MYFMSLSKLLLFCLLPFLQLITELAAAGLRALGVQLPSAAGMKVLDRVGTLCLPSRHQLPSKTLPLPGALP